MSAVRLRFRDVFRKYIPSWLSDRPGQLLGKTVGFRYLWSMLAPLDAVEEVFVQGVQAAWPGLGTPTAIPYIGRSRSLIRGQDESDDDYCARLRKWLEAHQREGSSEAIATAIHIYLRNHPTVRVVNRAGEWVTIDAGGVLTKTSAAWNWDGTSHPERNDADKPWWSEVWVIVYPTQWAITGPYGAGGTKYGGVLGLGHGNNRVEYDAVKGLLAQWKSAHTKVRAVIWTSDAALFDPGNPGSLPNGTWGAWGGVGNGSRVPSGRNRSTCRYWEP